MDKTELNNDDMVASLQVSYPEYCTLMMKEADIKAYHRGRTETIQRYEDHIDEQAALIGTLTAACEKLRVEIKELKA